MLITQERPHTTQSFNDSMIEYHKEHLETSIQNINEREYNWYQQKHYINYVLDYFLKTQQHTFVTEFITSQDLFHTNLTIGLLQNTDFSSYINSPFIETKDPLTSFKKLQRSFFLLFKYSHNIILNKEASQNLLTWAQQHLAKETPWKLQILQTNFDESPVTLIYDKEYDIFVKKWFKKIKRSRGLKSIPVSFKNLWEPMKPALDFTPVLKGYKFFTFRQNIKSIFINLLPYNYEFKENLKNVHFWFQKEKTKMKESDYSHLYNKTMNTSHSGQTNLYNKKSDYLAWAIETLYEYVEPKKETPMIHQPQVIALTAAYNLNTKPETKAKAKRLLKELHKETHPEDLKRILERLLNSGLITELNELYEDYPEHSDHILIACMDAWLPIPESLRPYLKEKGWEKHMVTHDGLSDYYKAYVYLKNKPSLPEFIFCIEEERLVERLLSEMGVEKDINMPDSVLASIFETLK